MHRSKYKAQGFGQSNISGVFKEVTPDETAKLILEEMSPDRELHFTDEQIVDRIHILMIAVSLITKDLEEIKTKLKAMGH